MTTFAQRFASVMWFASVVFSVTLLKIRTNLSEATYSVERFDERQITHLICARLKYDLYDFFRRCFGPASCSFSCRKGPTPPLKKSYRSYLGGHRLDE